MLPVTKTLDISKPQSVEYCIPLWLRDLQIKESIRRIPGRIEHYYEKREDPIAIVCYGPSLADTWEKLRDFKYSITCSGAHKFLVDRGIIPTWHCDVDPRKHKVILMGQPHPQVEYLMASTCHSAMWDHLEGFNVKLWHIFDSAEEGLRILPHGEWALTGGCGAGLRAMLIARFLGFTDLHIFGMDGNARPESSGTHAAEHPNSPPAYAQVEYEGKTYYTTTGYLEAARNTGYELDQMKDVRATFYGEGLVQAMMRNHQRKPPDSNAVLAYSKPETISAEYRKLNAQLHRDNIAYGVGGGRHAPVVMELVHKCNLKSVLDYGCGKGLLAKELPFPIWEYDPCIPGKEESPKPADLVCCTDVLEHIEPEKLLDVLRDLQRVVKNVGYFVIHTGPAKKTLPDGRNTHLIQKSKEWWQYKLEKFFKVGKIVEAGPELRIIVGINPEVRKKKILGNVISQ